MINLEKKNLKVTLKFLQHDDPINFFKLINTFKVENNPLSQSDLQQITTKLKIHIVTSMTVDPAVIE